MYTFGIDIGSTTSKCVVMEDGQRIAGTSLLVGGIGTKSPELAVSQALENAGVTWDDLAATAATGYGRNRCPATDSARTILSPRSARLSTSADRTPK